MIFSTHHPQDIDNKGFTLIELMITLAIVSILMATLGTLFLNTSRVFTQQMATADLQQEIRASLDIMSRYIRMAGYDPSQSNSFKIETATPFDLKFSADMNDDGTRDATTDFDDCEIFTFVYTAGTTSVQMICSEGTGSQNTQTLMGGAGIDTNVIGLLFDYRDNQNNPTTAINDIRSVIVTLTAQTPAGRAGMVQRSYSTRVECRNLGI